MTILLVEQNARFALSLADRAYVLNRGAVQWQGTAQALIDDRETQAALLGV